VGDPKISDYFNVFKIANWVEKEETVVAVSPVSVENTLWQ
jgi:hypothetical protein